MGKQFGQLLLETSITAGLAFIAPQVAAVPLIGILGGCVEDNQGDLSAGLIGRGVEYFSNGILNRENGLILNHDVQKALLAAFQSAIEDIQKEWKEKNPDDKRGQKILKDLQRDAKIRGKKDEDLLSRLLPDEELKNLMENEQSLHEIICQPEKLQQVVDRIASNKISDHYKLYPFITENLPKKWEFHFRQKLKSEEGTKAWRAFVQLYHESLQKSVEEIQNQLQQIRDQTGDIAEIKNDVQETNEKVNELLNRLDEAQNGLSTAEIATNNSDNQERRKILRSTLEPVTKKLQNTAVCIQDAADRIEDATRITEEAAKMLSAAVSNCDDIVEELQRQNEELGEKVGRLGAFVSKLERILDAYMSPIVAFGLILALIPLIQLISQDGYKGQTLVWSWIVGILLVGVLGYTVWTYYPWKLSHYVFFSILFLIAIGSVSWYVVPATASELFPSKMEGSVNIVIADFVGDEGKTISEFIAGGVEDQLFERSQLSKKEIKLRRHKAIHTQEEARSIAERFDANIVIWGGKIDQNLYHSRFYVRDPVEGGLDVAVRLNIPADAGNIVETMNEKTNITVIFVTGLSYLFKKDPLALKAITEFDRAIRLVEETSQGEGGGLDDIEYVLYFFKGRSHAEAGQDDEALKSYNKTLELNPEYTWAYVGRATVYFDRATTTSPANVEFMEKALQENHTAIKTHQGPAINLPGTVAYVPAKAFVNVGNIYSIFAEESVDNNEFQQFALESTKAYSRALETYEQISTDSERSIEGRYPAKAYYGLGVVYTLEGDRFINANKYRDALEAFDECIKLVQSDPNPDRAAGMDALCKKEKERVDTKLKPSVSHTMLSFSGSF
jgi:tetratricopeptide (TPR) repeat protein